VFYGVFSARLQNIEKPADIALYVGLRGDGRVTDARLGGEGDDHVEALARKQRFERPGIADVKALEVWAAEGGQAGFFQRYVVAVIEVVNSDNIIAPITKQRGYLGADKTSRSCYQYLQSRLLE
jgi:hypothetical protein